VDAAGRVVAGGGKIPGGPGFPLAARVERELGRGWRVRLENDASAAAWGELRFGAGRGCRDLLTLTLGTGVGGGMILDGRLRRGPDGTAGEVGHLVVEPRGRRCPCGGRGCLEAYGGARGLVRTAGGLAATPHDLARLARRGNARARAAFRRYGASLGIALASLVNLLNPERIILTGGIARAFSLFAPALREEVRRRALRRPGRRVRIVRGELGDDAGALGAAARAALRDALWESGSG
jgi:glucokinase